MKLHPTCRAVAPATSPPEPRQAPSTNAYTGSDGVGTSLTGCVPICADPGKVITLTEVVE